MATIEWLNSLREEMTSSNITTKMIFDFSQNKDLTIALNDNNAYLISLKNVNNNCNLHIDSGKNNVILIDTLVRDNVSSLSIDGNIQDNSHLFFYFADFSQGKEKINVKFSLKQKNSSLVWRLSSLSSQFDDKEFDVSVVHECPDSFAQIDNYGVCKDDAKLVFSGESIILNKSSGCQSQQNAKIMVFDKESNGVVKPVLKIDENDVEASHTAVVGRINEEHLFYLTSRGLNEREAKQLITFGYLKPILEGFEDEDIKDEINQLIEGRM